MTKPEVLIRASAAGRILACPASRRAPQAPIEEQDPAAALGTAAHAALAEVCDGDEPDLTALAAEHSVGLTDLRVLVANGRRLLAALREMWEAEGLSLVLESEAPLYHPDLRIGGTADLLMLSDTGIGPLWVVDWKSGRVDADNRIQVMVYATLAMLDHDAAEATCVVAWLRERELESWTITLHQGLALLRRLHERAQDDEAVAGERCTFCPRRHECDTHRDRVTRGLQALGHGHDLATATDESILALYDMARLVKKQADEALRALQTVVTERGTITTPAALLTTKEVHKATLDPTGARPILKAHGLTEGEIEGCSSLRKSRLEELLRTKHPRGEKTAAVAALREALKPVTTTIVTHQLRREVNREESPHE